MDFLQAVDKKLDIHIVKTEEQFKTVHAEIAAVKVEVKALNENVEGLRAELRNDVVELRTQQRATDSQLWDFVVGLVTLVRGGVIKVLWFDRG